MNEPKIYTSQQFEQFQSIAECPRCHEEQEMYIELGCGHKYCIVCITFSYLKYKNILTHENKLKCLECEKLSQLDEELDQLIKQIINKELGPIVKNDSDGNNTVENNESRMSVNEGFVIGSNGAYNNKQEGQNYNMQTRSYERNYVKNNNNAINRSSNNNNSNKNSKPVTPNNNNNSSSVNANHAHIINNNQHQNNNFSKNVHAREHKHTFKSQEESLIVSHTPPKHPNRFYSKCETPQQSRSSQQSQHQQEEDHSLTLTDNCPIHQQDEISYICVTCSFKPLCYKCIKSNKHYNHQVKIIKKAVEIINQKLSLLNLETIQKIQNMELYQKRLYDRKLIYEERIEKSIKEIKNIFLSLEKKIAQKTNQIIDSYQEMCASKIQEIENRALQNSQMLQKIKHFQIQVHEFLTHSQYLTTTKQVTKIKPSKLIKQFQQIQTTKSILFPKNQHQGHISSIFRVHEQIIDPTSNYQSSQLIRWVGKISQEIDSITIKNFNQYQNQERVRFNQTVPVASILKNDKFLAKNKTVQLRECNSKQKIIKNSQNNFDENHWVGKRVKTNIPISLNTSRDKRDKKHNTKTQEDERRLKSKANYKTQANTMAKNSVNTATDKHSTKQVPAYITKCIQKHNTQNSRKVSPFNHTTAYMIENSKNVSKIVGKTNILNNHDETNNRKKMKDTGSCEVIKQKKHMIKSAKHMQGVVKKKK